MTQPTQVRVKKTTHAEIDAGDVGEFGGIVVEFEKAFLVGGAVPKSEKQKRKYLFAREEVEFLGDLTTTVATSPETRAAPAPAAPTRYVPPDTGPGIRHKFDIGGYKGFLHIGFKDDANKQPIEIFVTWSRSGSTLGGVTACFARAVSKLLQYGVPLEEVVRMFEWHRFEPSGPVKDRQIKECTSVIDYIARYLGYNYVPGYKPNDPK